jgi:hypothetical protein
VLLTCGASTSRRCLRAAKAKFWPCVRK